MIATAAPMRRNTANTSATFSTNGTYVLQLLATDGALFTNNQVPLGTSRVNFTSSGALGMHVLGKKLNWSAEVRYMHISNAGISSANPGINTLQLRLGVGMFTPRPQ